MQQPIVNPAPDHTRCALTLCAPSERGQVASITALLDDVSAYIEEFNVFDDDISNTFFLRCVFRLKITQESAVREALASFNQRYQQLIAKWPQAQGSVTSLQEPAKVLIMVSKADHCLQELLAQWRDGQLPMQIVGIVSNHPTLEPLAKAHGIAYYHLPITPETKPAQEKALLALVESTHARWVVLARYMQVLSDATSKALLGRAINIHHSFLPGFKGARPYEQAHARGVKMIGATAHFVTSDLDEGPIIEQAVERVDHAFKPQQLQQTSKHLESLVLSRAMQYALEHRVFLNGQRVVVLR
jgi:formyltetrahydrofolate deformylase